MILFLFLVYFLNFITIFLNFTISIFSYAIEYDLKTNKMGFYNV